MNETYEFCGRILTKFRYSNVTTGFCDTENVVQLQCTSGKDGKDWSASIQLGSETLHSWDEASMCSYWPTAEDALAALQRNIRKSWDAKVKNYKAFL